MHLLSTAYRIAFNSVSLTHTNATTHVYTNLNKTNNILSKMYKTYTLHIICNNNKHNFTDKSNACISYQIYRKDWNSLLIPYFITFQLNQKFSFLQLFPNKVQKYLVKHCPHCYIVKSKNNIFPISTRYEVIHCGSFFCKNCKIGKAWLNKILRFKFI